MADTGQLDCGCGNQSTLEVCGTFETPTNPDLGRCHQYRTKRTCEAPVRPIPECNDTAAYAEYRPNLVPHFIIVASLFDEDCDPILDQDGNRIMAQL